MVNASTGIDSMNADLNRPFKNGIKSAPTIKINGGAIPVESID